MGVAEIRFEREDREGVVPVGTYLIDAMHRFGIGDNVAVSARKDGAEDHELVIRTGSDLLSELTSTEQTHFESSSTRNGRRLASQTRIVREGELIVVTKEKKKSADAADPVKRADDADREYREKFAEMPLEKKVANLVRLESIALGETVAYVFNSPFKIADLLFGVMAEFGFRKEQKQRSAGRPEEHVSGTKASDNNPGGGEIDTN